MKNTQIENSRRRILFGFIFFLMCCSLLSPFQLHAQVETKHGYKIEHLEPPSWWVGMQHESLQLMVHGANIADLTASVTYPGVTLTGQSAGKNPNYLFIDLSIAKSTLAGKLTLQFSKNNQVVLNTDYHLATRKPLSAQRLGFSNADAIYLIVPDRFSNGDSSNDDNAALADVSNRKNPGGRHGGDLQGISNHLDYIAKLGFTMLWPTPLIENKQKSYSYHGYSATDFYQIDARFGSNASYRDLVSKAKQNGLGTIQDVVLNHIGSGHWWMQDLPSVDWLNYPTNYTETSHVRSTIQDPHAASSDRKKFTDGWFSPNMPDLNQSNPFLANYLIQQSIWWIEYADLSGLRTDTYSYSDKTFLAQWSHRIMAEYPRFSIVGEEWSMNPSIVAYWQRGKLNHDGYQSAMPSMMDFSVYDNITNALINTKTNKADLTKLYQATANDFVYSHPEDLVIFEGNHDTPRLFSALGNDFGLYKMAMVYLATMRGTPQVFYGSEILMTSPKERNDGIVRSDFPGGWDGDKINAFTGKNLSKQQREAQAFVAKVFNWRKQETAVHNGKMLHFVPEKNTYVYFRILDNKKIMVILNRNEQSTQLALARFEGLMHGHKNALDVLSNSQIRLEPSIKIPAKGAMILELR
jgi:glycosidase